ncbi:hypothetical protein MCOR25_010021 [Pyricularia grisea]|uniref:Uracil-DNA glycosylase n=1 Tax=Pyricularia grisea TaxID=148305 RepID=A0A6P8BFZ3_PYRGI|nr:uncharacterized protein PgNI_00367 [Pyricularia grisea]KAI6351296.1 hypothetical protein MCOR25_010021 [Pyricularia grisea]TLD15562.1 hypothetical protein PgNI_00367 [Pyricularia grisea]
MSTLKRKANGALLASDAKKPKQNGSITSFFGAPKTTSAGGATTSSSSSSTAAPAASAPAHPPAASFNKQKWVEKLTDEQRELLKLEIDTLDESWLALLKDEITTKEFLDLKRFLDREANAGKKVFPPREDVYSWSRHTPFHTVKVVILGQDPYHNINQAHGLAFSVRPPTKAPPSLKNMYICLKNDYPAFTPPPNNSGLLTPWAQRGVLMLNTCLTVRAHEANSHANRGWEKFTQKIIELVAGRRSRGVVFMAWGSPAAKRVIKVDQKKHLVLKAVHPSPLSASRGFFDCGHFRKANEWLVQRYGDGEEIDWSLTEGVSLLPKPKVEVAKAAPAADKAKKDEEEEFDFDEEEELEALEELRKIEDNKKPEVPTPLTAKQGIEDKGDENKDPSTATA